MGVLLCLIAVGISEAISFMINSQLVAMAVHTVGGGEPSSLSSSCSCYFIKDIDHLLHSGIHLLGRI